MPTSTGKEGRGEGEEERDGGIEGWFDCGGEGWREWMTVVWWGVRHSGVESADAPVYIWRFEDMDIWRSGVPET